MSRKFKLVVFVPEADLESLKKALFDAGAGRQGNYDRCCWQSLGIGQFRPLEGSNPHLGNQNKVEQVKEWRLETLVNEDVLADVVKVLKETHPYEEPAYDLISLYAP